MPPINQNDKDLLDLYRVEVLPNCDKKAYSLLIDVLRMLDENLDNLHDHYQIITSAIFKINTVSTGVLAINIELADEFDKESLSLHIHVDIEFILEQRKIIGLSRDSVIATINHKNIDNGKEVDLGEFTQRQLFFKDYGEQLISKFLDNKKWVNSLNTHVFHAALLE